MTTLRDFSGKVVIVTGSSAGIGAEAVIQFSKAGAQVVVTGRNANNVTEVAKQCLKVSPKKLKPLEVVADVSSDEDCKRLIDSTVNEFGKLDILVNNAGVGSSLMGIYDPNILDTYKRIMDTNLRSVIYLTHLSVEHLEKTKGNIINISSALSIKPRTNFMYSCSKSALDMFTKCLALELGPKGIRVNVINPGLIRTNFQASAGRTTQEVEKSRDLVGKSSPLRRIGETEDIVNAILFLASDESSFVTGINFISDGGFLCT